jgi:hypothetical protein
MPPLEVDTENEHPKKTHQSKHTKAHPYLAPNAQQWEGKKGKEIPIQMKNNEKI